MERNGETELTVEDYQEKYGSDAYGLVAYILNMKQVYLYMRNGAKLLDILYSDTKANALVFVFEKNEQLKKLYELWNQHELN